MITGCHGTSKIGTKSSAIKNNPERFLEDFRIGEPFNTAFKSVEHYLVNVIQPSSNIRTFDELRYEMYRTQEKRLSELPLTFGALADKQVVTTIAAATVGLKE